MRRGFLDCFLASTQLNPAPRPFKSKSRFPEDPVIFSRGALGPRQEAPQTRAVFLFANALPPLTRQCLTPDATNAPCTLASSPQFMPSALAWARSMGSKSRPFASAILGGRSSALRSHDRSFADGIALGPRKHGGHSGAGIPPEIRTPKAIAPPAHAISAFPPPHGRILCERLPFRPYSPAPFWKTAPSNLPRRHKTLPNAGKPSPRLLRILYALVSPQQGKRTGGASGPLHTRLAPPKKRAACSPS